MSTTDANVAAPDKPIGSAPPQDRWDFVPGASCGHLDVSCAAPSPLVCQAQVGDYQRRLAADPSIPVETWTPGRMVHFAGDGTVIEVGPPMCKNTTPPPADSDPVPVAPVVTGTEVLTAFRSLALPVPTARMSPAFPACVHLNLPNYVYVDPIDTDPKTITVLDTPVTVYPRVVDYTWDFGDGDSLTTTDPGAAWPDGTVSHVYRHPGRYEVTVTVRWAADWSSPMHARSAVPGQTTTTSAPGVVWAHEVHVVLVNSADAVLPTKAHDPADACYQH